MYLLIPCNESNTPRELMKKKNSTFTTTQLEFLIPQHGAAFIALFGSAGSTGSAGMHSPPPLSSPPSSPPSVGSSVGGAGAGVGSGVGTGVGVGSGVEGGGVISLFGSNTC